MVQGECSRLGDRSADTWLSRMGLCVGTGQVLERSLERCAGLFPCASEVGLCLAGSERLVGLE